MQKEKEMGHSPSAYTAKVGPGAGNYSVFCDVREPVSWGTPAAFQGLHW